ncbi:MAG: Eco57I restriction-modification methylase domain-containing protein [Bacilli bacterium]|nr:Eco57I restriction-modification methylase domain-containing protein [Bacilli bacterium]
MLDEMNYTKCQVFTPTKYAKLLLSSIDYEKNLFGKKVLENSFGDGAILVEIVQTYIDDCRKNNFSNNKIKQGLENDIYGYEIDENKYKSCIEKLNQKVLNNNMYETINWKFKQEDFLKAKIDENFFYIIGNPPYINYKQLTEDNRIYLKENFNSCKYGRFDYCYAFIEKSFNLLSQDGKMSYLIPNSIYKNVSAKDLRNIIKPYIKKIIDNYGADVFPNVTVTTSILCIVKCLSKSFNYYDNITQNSFDINKDNLVDKWKFLKIYETSEDSKKELGSLYNVGSTLATLFNKAFVFEIDNEDELYYYVGTEKIEKEITKKALSPKNCAFSKTEYIIFPYKINDNKEIKRYTEQTFKEKFPFAYKYLEKYKIELTNKDNESGVNWFEYGRSQSLTNMNQKKIMMSIIITNKVKVYELSENEIPYSGIYITEIDEKYTLEKAKETLESDDFLNYINEIGITSSGKSKRITPNDVKKYMF